MRGFDIKTQEDVDAYYRRQGFAPPRHGSGSIWDGVVTANIPLPPPPPQPRPPRKVSKTEQRYRQVLEVAQEEGHIKTWWPCPLRLWLAPKLSYTSDYLTQAGGPDVLLFPPGQPITLSPAFAESLCRVGSYRLTLIEVKHTFMFDRRRALDRLKTAAVLYPMLRFRLAIWDRQQQRFLEQEIPAL